MSRAEIVVTGTRVCGHAGGFSTPSFHSEIGGPQQLRDHDRLNQQRRSRK